jgi:Tol biopolymer transport system component
MVYEYGEDIYIQDVSLVANQERLDFKLAKDYKFYPMEQKSFTNGVNEYALSPNEDYIAMVIRGEIFITKNDKDKKRSVRITRHPYRDQGVEWVNDSTLLFISDRNGNNDIFIVKSKDPLEGDLFKTFKYDIKPLTQTEINEEWFAIAPDKSKIAVRSGRGKLSVANITTGDTLSNEITLIDGWDVPEGISWSPDSKWLAYALEDLDYNEDIYIHAADNSAPPVNISMHPRSDYSPKWSRDGKKLGFLSVRNNGDADVWFAWLKRSDWEKTQEDWDDEDEEDDDEKENGKDKKNDNGKVQPIEIDFEDIHERLAQVTGLPGNETNLVISKDGQTFYFTTNGSGRRIATGKPALMSIKWNGKELKTLKEDFRISSASVDKNGKNIYMLKSGIPSKLIIALFC